MGTYEPISKVKLNASAIQQWRAKKGFTQREAADFCGVGISAYQGAEGGKFIQLVKAGKISKAMRRDLEDLKVA